ncbi:DsrE family protein [Chloroflexota bacterium]
MANKVFVILSSGDREVALEVGLVYPYNAATKDWMDEVKVIIFGPSEKIAASDAEVQARLKELLKAGIEVMACKWCADRMGITDKLEAAGIKVVYVGSIISDLLKEGWASLTF